MLGVVYWVETCVPCSEMLPSCCRVIFEKLVVIELRNSTPLIEPEGSLPDHDDRVFHLEPDECSARRHNLSSQDPC